MPQVEEIDSRDQTEGHWRRPDLQELDVDQEDSQFFVQLGIDENQDPEALHRLLMDVNISAGERALIQRRLLNMNKPKTAGAQRNMGKKKLSTVPANVLNPRIISGSGISAHGQQFFSRPEHAMDSQLRPHHEMAAFPGSTLLSAHRQPGETESHTKTSSQLPTMTRSYSVWKENFAIRKDIGYETYKQLPRTEIEQIMRQLRSECNLRKRRVRAVQGVDDAMEEEGEGQNIEREEEDELGEEEIDREEEDDEVSSPAGHLVNI